MTSKVSGRSVPRKTLSKRQNQLVMSHISVADAYARSFEMAGLSRKIQLVQLVQDARYGLCMAALRFDESRGVLFRTYAEAWMKKYILMDLRGFRTCDETDIDIMPDEIIDEDEVELQEQRAQQVEALLSLLDDKERAVITLLYGLEGEPMDFRQVSKKLKLESKRVHQIYESAMIKMESSNQ